MISLADVQAARARIRESIRITPAAYSENLSRETGNTVLLKLETFHVTGSYKERGALNGMLAMRAEDRARGVIAASAGNHAQGIAYHAGRLGIHATICMPVHTPLVKISATRNWGAEVVLSGENFDEASIEAQRLGQETGATFLHAFDDSAVIAGQGTIGLELLDQVPDLEAVIVPVGGGGLIAGIGCAIKETHPKVRVIGVEPSALPSMSRALALHAPVEVAPATTIADGVAVRRVGDLTFPAAEKYIDEMLTVEDEEIAIAILRLLEKRKLLAEGAGAVGLAALLQSKTSLRGARVAVVISGGNIDITLLAHIIERGLVKDGRLVRLRVTLPDHPGGLERLAGLIARERANIVQAVHDRAYYGVHLGNAQIDITVETRGADHAAELMGSLTRAGYAFDRVM
jgi:threonine dehydratase